MADDYSKYNTLFLINMLRLEASFRDYGDEDVPPEQCDDHPIKQELARRGLLTPGAPWSWL